MASLYQRFSGKINTSRSFPVPPEASHLLGAQSSDEDGAAGKTARPLQQENSRPRFQYQPRSDCEEEDVSAGVVRVGLGFGCPPPPAPTPSSCRMPVCPSRLTAISCGLSARRNGSFRSASSPEVPGIVRDGAEPGLALPRAAPAPLPVTWLLARQSLPWSRAGGLGDAGSARLETATASSGRLPPGEATRLPPPPSPPPFFFSLVVIPCFTL